MPKRRALAEVESSIDFSRLRRLISEENVIHEEPEYESAITSETDKSGGVSLFGKSQSLGIEIEVEKIMDAW
jgi:hypothetical protein